MKQKNNRKCCAAMIMKRHYIEKDSYIYSCDYTALGEIDTSTGIFYDRNGKGYKSVVKSLDSLEPDAYYWIIELSKLKEEYPAYSQRDSLKEFENDCKKDVCFAYKAEDGLPVTVIQSLEEWRDLRFDVEKDEFEEGEDEYTKLVEEIVNNKYTIRDLKKIKENLLKQQEGIESAIESVNISIEARHSNQSYLEYYEKKLKKLEEEAKKIEENLEEPQEEIEEKQEEKKEISINEVYNKVTKTLIAQEEPARRLIAEITRKEEDEEEGEKSSGILLTGQSGSGKTLLMKLIAENINRPLLKVNATDLTMPGYVGRDIEEVLWDLYIECGRDLNKTEHAIIFFDEIDKKGSDKKSDVSGQGVLNVLLPFIEGAKYDACADIKHSATKIKIDTTNMTVILGGAYTDVYKNLLQKNEIGFGGNTYDKPTYREAEEEDFVTLSGMTNEFMGRLLIIKLNDLDVDAIKRILLESDISKLRVQERIFEKLGTKITFTDGCLTKIAERAVQKKTGARGLNKVILETTWKAYDEVHEHKGVYKEVQITEETVDDPSNFKLVKKRGRKKKND